MSGQHAGSHMINWTRFKQLVRQDFTMECYEPEGTIHDLRLKAVWPGEAMELEMYEHRSDNRIGSVYIHGASNKTLRLRGNVVTVVPEVPGHNEVHPGMEISFYELAPVPTGVLKGISKKRELA